MPNLSVSIAGWFICLFLLKKAKTEALPSRKLPGMSRAAGVTIKRNTVGREDERRTSLSSVLPQATFTLCGRDGCTYVKQHRGHQRLALGRDTHQQLQELQHAWAVCLGRKRE